MKAILATALTVFLLIGSTAVVEYDSDLITVPCRPASESERSSRSYLVLTGPTADGTFWQTIDLRASEDPASKQPSVFEKDLRQNYLLRLIGFYAIFLIAVLSYTLRRVIKNAP